MPSKEEQVTAEAEWEDVAEDGAEEEEEDTTLNNSDVVMKYKAAAVYANEALQAVIAATKPGARVSDLCVLGDQTMTSKLASTFRGVEKGIAFPTCVSVNACVAHYSPGPNDEPEPVIIALNDVVHIDLAVHIGGFCAQVAHTLQVTENGELVPGSKEANVITAAYTALQTAVRKLRPGTSVYEVTSVIEKVAEHFGVQPVDGVLSHVVKQYIIDGVRCIPMKKVPEHMVHDYEIEPPQVWALDIVFSTGKGKLKERDARPWIFKLALESNYASKMESARELQREIDEKYQTFPFAVRNLETKKARLGLTEMLRHNVVVPYPVLYERDGDVLAQFKMTVLVTAKKIDRITGLPMQKGPAPTPFTDELLLTTSKLPFSLEEKTKKKKTDAATS